MQELHVRHVAGRYGRGVLRSSNVVATVQEVARVFRIRIDDTANPDAWLEITVEAETLGEPKRVPAVAGNPAEAAG